MRHRLFIVFGAMTFLAGGCGASATSGGEDLSVDTVDADGAGVCLGTSCDSPADCGPPGPCVSLLTCEGGCCVADLQPEGSACVEPCIEGGTCDSEGTCIGGALVSCPDEDGNPCTESDCDPKTGLCGGIERPVEDGTTPFDTACWTGIICAGGEPDLATAEATDLKLNCENQDASKDLNGCIEGGVLHRQRGRMPHPVS